MDVWPSVRPSVRPYLVIGPHPDDKGERRAFSRLRRRGEATSEDLNHPLTQRQTQSGAFGQGRGWEGGEGLAGAHSLVRYSSAFARLKEAPHRGASPRHVRDLHSVAGGAMKTRAVTYKLVSVCACVFCFGLFLKR